MKNKPTQHELIIKRLKAGWCTGFEAIFSTGSMKLATRVSELRRAGWAIADKWVEVGGKRFKAYKLVKARA